MISDKARPYYAAITDDLLKFYREEGIGLGDEFLFAAIVRRFGDRLIAEVCAHLDLDIGECAIGAIALMKEHAREGLPC